MNDNQNGSCGWCGRLLSVGHHITCPHRNNQKPSKCSMTVESLGRGGSAVLQEQIAQLQAENERLKAMLPTKAEASKILMEIAACAWEVPHSMKGGCKAIIKWHNDMEATK